MCWLKCCIALLMNFVHCKQIGLYGIDGKNPTANGWDKCFFLFFVFELYV